MKTVDLELGVATWCFRTNDGQSTDKSSAANVSGITQLDPEGNDNLYDFSKYVKVALHYAMICCPR